jgi:hypothetical protein
MANVVLNIVHLPEELDVKIRLQAVKENVHHGKLLKKYIKLGMKAAKKKSKKK